MNTTQQQTQLIEKINIWNPKLQGLFIEVISPEIFALNRCKELNETEESKKFNHDYQFMINPTAKRMPCELYKTTAISANKGSAPVTIAIYRNFKK